MAEALSIRYPQLVAAALGANLWLTMLVVPALHLRAETASAAALGLLAVIAAALLAAGVARRSRWLLLAAFPAALVAGPTLEPALAGPTTYTPLTVLPVAAALWGHLVGALHLCRAAAAPPEPLRRRALAAAPPSAAWRRRFRIYRGFAVLAAVFPAALLAAVHYRPGGAADVARSFPEQASTALVVLDACALGLWLGLFLVYFAGTLRVHLEGDRVTLAENLAVRQRLLRTHSRAHLYVLLTAAFVLLAVLWLLRYR